MNLKDTQRKIITTKSWQEKSYLLNKVFIQGDKVFENTRFKNFSAWLKSFKEEALKLGINEGYNDSTLMSLRTTGGDYLLKMHNFDTKTERKNPTKDASIIENILNCKVKSYKTLHHLIKQKQYTEEQRKLIESGKLERKHVQSKNNVTPLILKLKKEFGSNPEALAHIQALENMVA